MIVWGGHLPFAPTGGIYDPVSDKWTATPTMNAPAGRTNETALWTDSRMIVWGAL